MSLRSSPRRTWSSYAYEHYEGFGGLFSSQVYVEDEVLVQIFGTLPEKDAERFGEGLREL